MSTELTTEELAYAAGFFDGEGCVLITKWNNCYSMRVCVTSTNLSVLLWMKERFGGCINDGPDPRPQARMKWCWIASTWVCVRFLEALLPFLKIKKPQAELALEFWKAKVDVAPHKITSSDLSDRERSKLQLSGMKLDATAPCGGDFSDAYAAGFFDAEGSVSIVGGGKTYNLLVSVANTARDILDRFSERFCGAVYVKDRTPKRDGFNRRVAWNWHASCKTADKFLESILPYLVVKKDQALLGIEYQAKKRVSARGTTAAISEFYRGKMTELNRRGKPVEEVIQTIFE